MRHHPKDIGDRSTLAIILALQEQGCTTYLPFGENTRCDLIVDDGERLSRVRCKTGRLRRGRQATLRVSRPKNAQAKRIRFAAQYEIARIDVY